MAGQIGKENCPDPILCERRKIINFINYLFVVITVSAFIFVEFANTVINHSTAHVAHDFLNAIPFVIFYILALASSPNVTVCEEGIYVHTLRKIVYVTWKEVVWVHDYPTYTLVVVKHLTIFHRLAGILLFNFRPIFTLSRTSHKNYDEAISVLKYKLGRKYR
jgi:hypothetical protein